MRFKMKRYLSLFVMLLVVLPSLFTTVFAATTVTPIDGCVTVTDSVGNGTLSSGTVTIQAKGGLLSQATNTITITNSSSSKAFITFDYSASNYSSFSESSASGTKELTLEASGTVTMTIKGKKAISSNTATLTLSNFTYSEIIEGPATITYNEYVSSVTVGGTAVSNGGTSATITGDGAELVATPVSGATFVAWVNADDNTILSQNATFTLKPYSTSMNIKAYATKADQAPYFKVGTTLYTDLDDAITVANSGSNKTVVAISSGTLPSSQTYTIPSGVSLLVPYSNSDLDIDSDTVIDESGNQGGTLINANMKLATLDAEGTSSSEVTAVLEPDTSVTYTLTVPTSTTINVKSGGKLVVGGVLVAGTTNTTGICGATGGAHSNIQLEGTINVESGGILSTCGYIKGSGTVNAASGGTVYQPFILMDHKDGHYLYAAKEESRFPVYRYAILNIQSNLVMNSGADMYGYCAVFTRANSFANARFNPTAAHIIGTGSDSAMYLVDSGSLTMSYDSSKTVAVTSSTDNNSTGYYSKVGRTTMTFNGDASLGSVSLSVVVMGSNYDMTSADSEFPVPYNFNLVQQSGTFSVNNNMALLPGSTFTVNSRAAMTVASDKSLVIYDGLRDYATRAESVTLDGDDETGGTWPRYHYPTSANLKTGGYSSTAELIMNGTLTVYGNLGGTVQTTGTTGSIIMDSGAGTSATGTFGVQQATTNLVLMEIGGSCGKTTRTLAPQVFIGADKVTPLEAGKSYDAASANTNTISSYTYAVYATHDTETATSETKTDLNATVVGTWQCADDSHSYESAVTAPTCTEPGYTTHTCTVCGDSYTDNEVSSSGHSYESVVTAPTCTTAGYTTYTCSGCGDSYSSDTVSAPGHTFNPDDGKCGICGEDMAVATVVTQVPQTDGSVKIVYTYYETLANAVAAYDNTGYIQMVTGSNAETTINKTVYLDLNGQTVTNVTVSGTLYGMDSSSNAYEAPTGSITLTSGSAASYATVNNKRYLSIANGNTYTFHRVAVTVTGVQFLMDTAGSKYIIFRGEYKGAPDPVLIGVGFDFEEGTKVSKSVTTDDLKNVNYLGSDGQFMFGFGTSSTGITSVTPQMMFNGVTISGTIRNAVDNILTADNTSDVLTFSEVFDNFNALLQAIK